MTHFILQPDQQSSWNDEISEQIISDLYEQNVSKGIVETDNLLQIKDVKKSFMTKICR